MKQMICQDCGNTQPYDQAGHQGDYQCHKCGGEYCGCDSCNALIEKLEAQDLKAASEMLSSGPITAWDCNTGWQIEE